MAIGEDKALWLCIDQGGHSSRALVFDARGRTIVRSSAPVHTQRRGLRVEHDPDQLIASVREAIAGVADRLGTAVRRLRGVGVATQRSTFVCVRRSSGEPLSPVISWQDRRGEEQLPRDAVDAERIRSLTGLRVSPHYGVGKIRWCMSHLAPVRRALAEHDLLVAPLASFLLHSLSSGSSWRIDPTNASRTLLMDARSLEWSDELLARFEVPAEILPTMAPCRSAHGELALDGFVVPITVLSGDQAAALFSMGEPRCGTCFVNIGTGAFLQGVIGARMKLVPGLLTSIAWAEEAGRLYVLEGTVNGAASAVDEVMHRLGFASPPAPSALRAALGDMASAPLFLNGVSGLGSPDWIADFPSGFVGTGAPILELAAVYESVVFLLMRNLARMRRSIDIEEIRVGGGLAQLDWMCQSLASLSGLAVRRQREAEATARGMAYLLGGSGAAGRCFGVDAVVFPPRSDAVAGSRYERWTQAMEDAVARVAGNG